MDSKTLPNVSALEAERLPRHRWYFFKEAFSPGIVKHAMASEDLPIDATVFDPFSGSGTTPLEAGLGGRRGVGTEVNPFLQFVANTKSQSASLNAFDKALKSTLLGIQHGASSNLATFSTFSEKAPKAKAQGKWLFNSKVLNAFEGGLQSIAKKVGPEYDMVRLCLIGAAMDSANAVKDGKCLRYRKNWDQLRFNRDSLISALISRADIVKEDLDLDQPQSIKASIARGDSRSFGSKERFDLCVTSPPYLNSFDYTDVYRPELFLSGLVKDMDQLRSLRLATLRSHVQVSWPSPSQSDFGQSYLTAIGALQDAVAWNVQVDKNPWNSRLPLMIQAYFEDMSKVLSRLRKRSKPDASIWLVVSTSAYCGVEIPVDLIIADIAGRSGWSLREVVVLRRLRRVACQQWDELSKRMDAGGPFLRESLVILDAS